MSNKFVGSMRSVFRGLRGVRVIGVASIAFIIGGCAVIPHNSQTSLRTAPVAERDFLTQAVAEVKIAPWPKPQSVSFVTRIAGGGGEKRVTRSDAIDAYLIDIQNVSDPIRRLESDARANLSAAARLDHAAANALAASRLSMNDVALVEDAIMALREQGQIYTASAKALKKTGAPVSDATFDMLHDEYRATIKQLGKTADLLAEQIEHDRSQTFAAPTSFTDL